MGLLNIGGKIMTEKKGEAVAQKAARHTPGPWEILGFGHIYSATAINIASTRGSLVLELNEMEANARLIAAAPDLLEACKEALAAIQGEWINEEDSSRIEAQLEAAIRKATDEAVNPD